MQSSADLSPSIEHLRVDNIVRSWGESPDIDWAAAITLAEMSKLAYEDAPTRQHVLTDLGFDEVVVLDKLTMSGFIAMMDDVAVVAFRGTDEITDWIANSAFYQLADIGSSRTVHLGFRVAYDLFASQVQELIENRRPKYVWITGHSLGGAMAACCAYGMIQKGVPFTGIVTFGQPRIGNEALAQFLTDKCGDRFVRFMNEGDPVPITPPCFGIKLPAYWHSGRRAWFFWGKLYTMDGPTLYAQTAPGTDDSPHQAPGELQEPTGNDEYPSMTEDDFLELQRQLKAMHEASPGHVAAATEAGTSAVQPMFERQGFIDSVKRFFLARIGEHKIDEYLRQLNEFRRKTVGDAK